MNIKGIVLLCLLLALGAYGSKRLLTEQQPVSEMKGEARRCSATLKPAPVLRDPSGCLPLDSKHQPHEFELFKDKQTIRFIGISDQGADEQARVGQALREWVTSEAREGRSIDFGITAGDNFYWRSIRSPRDSIFETRWEQMYGSLGIPFYATLGNHDLARQSCISAEVLRTDIQGSTFRMPAEYYAFSAGLARFIALNTSRHGSNLSYMSDPQRTFFREQLKKAQGAWKIAYSHHPVISGGSAHGDETEHMQTEFCAAQESTGTAPDLIISGHDHDMQFLDWGDSYVANIGAGGRNLRNVEPVPGATKFCAKQHGFAVFEITEQSINVQFLSVAKRTAQPAFRCTITRKQGQLTSDCDHLQATQCEPL